VSGEQEAAPNERGVWVAYHSDWSDFVIFRSEMKALRHAVDNTMGVVFVPFGRSPREVADKGAKEATKHG
jgi:hypothetical protein